MSQISVGIVNYGVGNLKSVANAVEHIGAIARVSSDEEILDECDRLILPGVGAFPHGIKKLQEARLLDFMLHYVGSGRRCLGICLGMQLLHQWSSEFNRTDGLGLLSGHVEHLTNYSDRPADTYRMPNVGWRPLERVQSNSELADRMLSALGPDETVYFIHSYGAAASGTDLAATSHCADLKFAAMVGRDNLVGTQFHPEKSREAGLNMLKAFIF